MNLVFESHADIPLDENHKVLYVDLVDVIGDEPNYDAALAAVS